jgi:hypothetical protein
MKLKERKVERIEYLLNQREHIILACTFLGLNILDAALTMILCAGGGYELNPIFRHNLEVQPAWIFWTVKYGVALIAVLLLLWFTFRFPRGTKNILKVLVFAMLGICLFNSLGLIWL